MTLDRTSEVQLEGAGYAAARAARAGAVGAVFGGVLAWILADSWRCEAAQTADSSAFACMGGALLGFVVLPLVALPVGWLLLRALEVRPAWAVALLGVLFSPAALDVAWSFAGGYGGHPPAWVVIPPVAAAYAASGLLAAPGLRVPYRIGAGVLALGAAAWAYYPVYRLYPLR